MPAIDRALCDPALLGAALGDPASWQTWLAVLRATFGLGLTDEQLQLSPGLTALTPGCRPVKAWTTDCLQRAQGPKGALGLFNSVRVTGLSPCPDCGCIGGRAFSRF
jgi:hypothetical protein